MYTTLLRITALCGLLTLSFDLSASTRVQQEVDLGNKPKITELPNNDLSQAMTSVDNPKVELLTNQGSIIIELFPDKAPLAVKNFLTYVNSGFYNNTLFHRVIRNLLIQGGVYTPALRIKPNRGDIHNEANNGLSNARGTVSAARRVNDSESANSQFFINVVDNPQFDFSSNNTMATRGYTVFGKIIRGQELIDSMRLLPTKHMNAVGDNVPKRPIIITQARVVD
jgi:peptidyl-prolyl cis-trans isomerase A (cyclophilin A)